MAVKKLTQENSHRRLRCLHDKRRESLARANGPTGSVEAVHDRILAAAELDPDIPERLMGASDVLRGIGIVDASEEQYEECCYALTHVFGGSKWIRGRRMWRVRFRSTIASLYDDDRDVY